MDVTRRFQSIKSQAREVVLLPPVLPSGLWYSGSEPVPKLEMVGSPAPVGCTRRRGLRRGRYLARRASGTLQLRCRCHDAMRQDLGRRAPLGFIQPKADELGRCRPYRSGNARDVRDRVIIAAPLHFPQTNVTIWARELRFQGSGAIDKLRSAGDNVPVGIRSWTRMKARRTRTRRRKAVPTTRRTRTTSRKAVARANPQETSYLTSAN